MTGWKHLDAIIGWVSANPEKFFLWSAVLYLFTAILGF